MTEPTIDSSTRFSAALSGRYQIERELGSGGMAVVYLARDVRHDRQVALKVLRPELAAAIGADRFLQEIRTTANLQHPHIVPLHDSGEVDGVVYYVMPFIEGEGLRDRLDRERQLPVADAVRIATQVASALDYAHRHGVIHRDIKPENILLHDGSAVVADFGISLAVQSAGGPRLTQTGLSLGTPQYMSPEQAMGERAIDGRTDIYALAAVLYEMLVGEPPFTGPTVQAIVARMMSERPRSIATQRHAVPRKVEAAVMRGLEKLPADRFATAAEFGEALESAAHSAGGTDAESTGTRWRGVALVLAGASVVLASALAWTASRSHAERVPLLTAAVAPSPEAPSEFRDIALSPDGATLAYVSAAAADGGRIWLRTLSDGAVKPINGSEGARMLFWAPDGSGIGFVSGGWLRVVTLNSGAVRKLASAPLPVGAAWGPDGTILYCPMFRQLWRVPAAGGTPRRALGIDDDSSQGSREPEFLPDGHRFLYWRTSYKNDEATWVGDLATGKAHKLIDKRTSPRYVEPGFLLFFQSTEQATLEQPAPLFAQRFDARTLTFSGEPFAVTGRVDRPDQHAIVSATRDIVLVRETLAAQDAGGGSHGVIYWLDRATGRRSEPLKGGGPTWGFRMSHDGRRIAMGGAALWMYDPARDVAVRVPLTDSVSQWPQVWSPDDREIALVGGPHIPIIRVDGSAPERWLRTANEVWSEPLDWSADGWLYYIREPSDSVPRWQLRRHNIAADKSELVPTGSGSISDARLSPDERWLAWESDQSGRHEIYLGPATGTTSPIRVSKAGGGSPRWRRDGKELFFLGGDGRIMSVSVTLGNAPVLGEPQRVADLVIHPDPFGTDPFLDTRFEPTPAGDRFLVQSPLGAGAHRLTLVQGWQNKALNRP